MRYGTSPLTQQLVRMHGSGMTYEQISETLRESDINLDPRGIELAIRTATTMKRVSADELIEKYRGEMIEVLYEIATDQEKNESARVKAAAIIVERKGCLPVMEATDLTDAFTRMRELVNNNKPKELMEPCVDV